jgi:hypothetical protein
MKALLCLIVIGAGLAAGCMTNATSMPPKPVQLLVIPDTLRPGMRATLLGVGFEQGEIVTFYLVRPDGSRTSEGESVADMNGGASYQLDVMEDWEFGEYMVHAASRVNPTRAAARRIKLVKR